MDMEATVSKRFKTKWHRNPVSGHEWPEHIETSQFNVSGCLFITSVHPDEKTAIREKELRESMARKFPFEMPRTARELEKTKRLGL